MTPPLFGQPIEPGEPKYTPEFEAFWAMSTMRGSKLSASKAFGKINQGEHHAVSIGMMAWQYSAQWTRHRARMWNRA